MLGNVIHIPEPERPRRVDVFFSHEVEIRFDLWWDWELN